MRFYSSMPLFVFLVLHAAYTNAQSTRVERVQALYDSLAANNVLFPKTVAAIAILETGWMECKKCAFKHNNLFGFRANGPYLKYGSIGECIRYKKQWQDKFYLPWKAKNPNGTYHQFLTSIKYAENMVQYLTYIRSIERWIKRNIKTEAVN